MPHQNRLLAALSEADGALLGPHLEAVDLPLGKVLVEPATAIPHAVFIDTGLCSMVSTLAEGARIEVGLFGRDGMAAPALLLGTDTIPYQVFMQVAGRGQRISVPALRDALTSSPSLRNLLLRYVQTFLVQVAQTAIANAGAPAEERLARWLLMYHDRQDGDDLSVTHEFLSIMLGVRRPTVTVAIHTLEGAGLIRARRGRIRVLSRSRLEEAAGQTYGPAEAEYERLIGPLRRTQSALA
ncbi:Crp/Fnr family transcriptional regulator [Methylobacterium sp. P1-11]|uniref:Crp/Fnr family transcriptional regulator n=1 Tax=Methylobacterium sp. P1-11 TaxID=2024616 RepID=UPI0011EC3CAA|nr:Crp/Fnr family transcriptional regulator [Methylobacterium sp. P1-11]KAA0125879.1 Crp/Fnr family transcriptional regulator [Methylobacterium sp. P1-11]